MNSQPFASLNRALKLAILDRGLTQRQLAKRTRIDETRLSRIVRGRLSPIDAERKALSRVLGQPITELFADQVTA